MTLFEDGNIIKGNRRRQESGGRGTEGITRRGKEIPR